MLTKILNLLDDSGMSDQEFIAKLGSKNKNLVYEWRNKITKSYIKYIDRIAELFNVTTDYLHGRSDKKMPSSKKPEGKAYTQNQQELDDLISQMMPDEVQRMKDHAKLLIDARKK